MLEVSALAAKNSLPPESDHLARAESHERREGLKDMSIHAAMDD
jgi:hypothetical protein